MKKEVQVVMLPTEKATNVYLDIYSNLHYTENENRPVNFQYLYFLSDDEIKEGDWAISKPSGKVYQVGNVEYAKQDGDKKIIAATESLQEVVKYDLDGIPCLSLSLPRPSKEFIKKSCKLGGIDKVLVEYETIEDTSKDYIVGKGQPAINILKVAPDNTISIYPIK